MPKKAPRQEVYDLLARKGYLDPDMIVRVCAAKFGFTPEDLKGSERGQQLAFARHVCCWMLVNHSQMSLSDAGAFMTNRDHTTIMHSCRRVEGDPDTFVPMIKLAHVGCDKELNADKEAAKIRHLEELVQRLEQTAWNSADFKKMEEGSAHEFNLTAYRAALLTRIAGSNNPIRELHRLLGEALKEIEGIHA